MKLEKSAQMSSESRGWKKSGEKTLEVFNWCHSHLNEEILLFNLCL